MKLPKNNQKTSPRTAILALVAVTVTGGAGTAIARPVIQPEPEVAAAPEISTPQFGGRTEALATSLKEFKQAQERKATQTRSVDGVPRSTLESIAACESGGDPAAVSSDGSYRGKYQFDLGTWASVGGQGDPAAAPEFEQDLRAASLLNRSGSSPWPICG